MTKKRIENSMYTPSYTYTYPGKLSEELNIKTKLGTPALSDFFTIKQGVRSGEWLNIVNPLSTVLEKGTAACAPTYTQSGSITARQLTTGLFEINKSWCKKEFQGLLTNYNVLGDSSLIGDGLSGYDLGGKLRSVILEEINEAARIDQWKVAFFGNDSLGSGSTNLYSAIDGIWTRYLDGFASYCIRPVTSALPNQNNSVLTSNQARDAFRAMWEGAPTVLKQAYMGANKPKFFVTGSMWENYYNSLIDNCCVEGAWRLQQDGTTALYYRGLEIVPLWFADEALQDSTNPYYNLLRHFAILTRATNNIFGVENMSDLNNLEICYDCRTKTTLIQGEMRFGVQYLFCDETVIAY